MPLFFRIAVALITCVALYVGWFSWSEHLPATRTEPAPYLYLPPKGTQTRGILKPQEQATRSVFHRYDRKFKRKPPGALDVRPQTCGKCVLSKGECQCEQHTPELDTPYIIPLTFKNFAKLVKSWNRAILIDKQQFIEQHLQANTIHGINEKEVRDYILHKKVKIYAFDESVFPVGGEDPMTWLANTLGISSTKPEYITTYRVLSPGELHALYGLYALALQVILQVIKRLVLYYRPDGW